MQVTAPPPLPPRDDWQNLALLVAGSVFVFLLTFASAHAWVLSAKWLITQHRKRWWGLGLAFVLTAVAFAGAFGFAYGSQNVRVRLPLDTSGLLSNIGLDVRDRRDQEDAAATK